MLEQREELNVIMRKFATSGWDLIEEPALEWLKGEGNKERIIQSIEQADRECGSCGCEYDALYKRVLELKEYI